MKKLTTFINEAEKSKEQQEYQDFFDKKLKKFGVDSPAKLSDDEKKKFFDEVEKEWTKDTVNEKKVEEDKDSEDDEDSEDLKDQKEKDDKKVDDKDEDDEDEDDEDEDDEDEDDKDEDDEDEDDKDEDDKEKVDKEKVDESLELNEGKNDFIAKFGKVDITIKNGHKLTSDEDVLYSLYESLGKVVKDSGLGFSSLVIK